LAYADKVKRAEELKAQRELIDVELKQLRTDIRKEMAELFGPTRRKKQTAKAA
jgi:hypothetical protein